MAEEKKPAGKKAAAPAEKRKPTAADLKAAAAQLEEQETGVRKNTAILRIIAFVLWILAAVAMYLFALFFTHSIRKQDILSLPMGEKIAKVLEKLHVIG